MRVTIIAALTLTGCQTASAGLERVRTAASYAVTISDAVCPFAALMPDQAPTVVKACAALQPMLPLVRGLLTAPPAGE